jgi:hypothetical protein
MLFLGALTHEAREDFNPTIDLGENFVVGRSRGKVHDDKSKRVGGKKHGHGKLKNFPKHVHRLLQIKKQAGSARLL